MNKILDRISQIAKNENITITSLEKNIGASKGVLSRAINNGTDIQSKWIQIIVENYPKYSTRWLLTGQGSMLNDSQEKTSEPIHGDRYFTVIESQQRTIEELSRKLK